MNFIEKLDQQLYKAFQHLNQTDMEYLYRLKDECLLIRQCDDMIAYLNRQGDMEKVARVGLIKLEHIYFKQDSLYDRVKEQLKNHPAKLAEVYFLNKPSGELIQELVDLVVKNCSYKLKIKAILLQCYHLSIHNKFHEARNLLLKSNITQSISKQLIASQIYYNRAVV